MKSIQLRSDFCQMFVRKLCYRHRWSRGLMNRSEIPLQPGSYRKAKHYPPRIHADRLSDVMVLAKKKFQTRKSLSSFLYQSLKVNALNPSRAGRSKLCPTKWKNGGLNARKQQSTWFLNCILPRKHCFAKRHFVQQNQEHWFSWVQILETDVQLSLLWLWRETQQSTRLKSNYLKK